MSSGPTFRLPIYVSWTVVFGTVIGVATFAYSVGNVPFEVVFFSNDLPFGSVPGYVYTDLIAPPIADAYREYYGTTFAAAFSGTIFVAAILTGVVIHFVFLGAGLTLAPESIQTAEVSVEANYKLVLNVFMTSLFGALYWLHRSKSVGDDGHDGHGGATQADG